MNFEYENLFWNNVEEYGLNLFLGAGFSVLAYNKDNERLYLGDEIKEILISKFSLIAKNETLDKVCRRIKDSNKSDFDLFMKEKYKVNTYDSLYDEIKSIKIKNIITTNIDDLIEKIFESEGNLYDSKIYGTMEHTRGIPLYKIHGSVTYPIESDLSFTYTEIRDLFMRKPAVFETVSQKLSSAPTLFWGIGISEGNVVELLKNSNTFYKSNAARWIIVNDDNNKEYIEELKSMNFKIIYSNTKDFLEYIKKKKSKQIKNIDNRLQNSVYQPFYTNHITRNMLKQTPRRPIIDFLSGAEPIYSDALSNSIAKTKYYSQVLDIIISQNNALIVGIPGSGKTTLLMQLACSDDIKGEKFYFDRIIKSQAESLVSILKGSKAIVFIDNISSEIEAIDLLQKSDNIQLVMADRSLNYETIKNHIQLGSKYIIDITDLELNDIKNICTKMNRSYEYALQLYNQNINISLLEIVFAVNKSSYLIEKIKKYVDDLESFKDDKLKIDLLELFTLVHYVNYCGVPCSMDMMLYYFIDDNVNYNDIYYALEKMNRIIIQSEEAYSYGVDQDYLVLRSKLFAEKTISCIQKSVLCNVLNKFYDKVEEHAVYRYDVFKKRAYDADITMMAFKLEQGIDFYEKLLLNDNNIYIRHQYAIFLFRNKKLDLAWAQIDQAYIDSKKRVYTISNTHAIILFENNINSKYNNEHELNIIKTTLKNSFDTLEYCITKDLRVNYHIFIYSKNSIEYYNRFGLDTYASYYLKFAYEQLKLLLNSNTYIERNRKKCLCDNYDIINDIINKNL